MSAPDFWTGTEAQKISAELSKKEAVLARWQKIENEYGELKTLTELLEEDEDGALQKEFNVRSDAFAAGSRKSRWRCCFRGPMTPATPF